MKLQIGAGLDGPPSWTNVDEVAHRDPGLQRVPEQLRATQDVVDAPAQPLRTMMPACSRSQMIC